MLTSAKIPTTELFSYHLIHQINIFFKSIVLSIVSCIVQPITYFLFSPVKILKKERNFPLIN